MGLPANLVSDPLEGAEAAVACKSEVLAGRLAMRYVKPSTACWRSRGGLLLVILASGSFFLCPSARPQQVVGPTNRYTFHQPHNPDGIGKFYMGREIARVMGHESAAWLERPERIAEEQPDQLVGLLGVRRGETVADIGAGTGYFSRRLAQAVGPTGRVLAEDVQPEMITLLTNVAVRLGLTNIIPVLGTTTDPRLPVASVDLALMVDVYHEFDLPYEMVQAICLALKPGGRLVLVEYRGEDPRVPIKPLHKMTEAQVKREMSVLPLLWVQTIERLPRQHIIVFSKRPSQLPVASAPAPFQER
jgi:ubiquinone/menaquinone biosynthesis C-methylase UbiE